MSDQPEGEDSTKPISEAEQPAAGLYSESGEVLYVDDEVSSKPPKSLNGPELSKYDPRPDHDKARRRIAYWLLALLTLLIGSFFVGLFFICPRPTFDQYKSLLEILLAPLLTLVSAATGFYFGSQSKK